MKVLHLHSQDIGTGKAHRFRNLDILVEGLFQVFQALLHIREILVGFVIRKADCVSDFLPMRRKFADKDDNRTDARSDKGLFEARCRRRRRLRRCRIRTHRRRMLGSRRRFLLKRFREKFRPQGAERNHKGRLLLQGILYRRQARDDTDNAREDFLRLRCPFGVRAEQGHRPGECAKTAPCDGCRTHNGIKVAGIAAHILDLGGRVHHRVFQRSGPFRHLLVFFRIGLSLDTHLRHLLRQGHQFGAEGLPGDFVVTDLQGEFPRRLLQLIHLLVNRRRFRFQLPPFFRRGTLRRAHFVKAKFVQAILRR